MLVDHIQNISSTSRVKSVNMFGVKNINTSSMKIITKKNVSAMVISPILNRSPFSIPDSPQYISIDVIEKTTNIYILKKLEHAYDKFLEKKCQILLLLNAIDEIFEIRDALIMRINCLERENRLREMRNKRRDFIKNMISVE